MGAEMCIRDSVQMLFVRRIQREFFATLGTRFLHGECLIGTLPVVISEENGIDLFFANLFQAHRAVVQVLILVIVWTVLGSVAEHSLML